MLADLSAASNGATIGRTRIRGDTISLLMVSNLNHDWQKSLLDLSSVPAPSCMPQTSAVEITKTSKGLVLVGRD